jgi:hypothetical protein
MSIQESQGNTLFTSPNIEAYRCLHCGLKYNWFLGDELLKYGHSKLWCPNCFLEINNESAKASPNSMNDILFSLIAANQPFAAVRYGVTEAGVLIDIARANRCNEGVKYWLEYGAGVWPTTDDFLHGSFFLSNLHAFRASDIAGFVHTPHAEVFQSIFGSKRNTWSRGERVFLDPVYILGKCWMLPSPPWTTALAQKSVLVISPFKETIEFQWERRYQVWGDGSDIIAPYKLVGVVRPPHPPVVTGSNYRWRSNEYSNWIDAAYTVLEDVSSISFDVALIGAGAMSPILAAGIKSLGKGAITLNSSTQLHFGIAGRRWNEHQPDTLNPLYNRFWLARPFDTDIPALAHLTPEQAYY